MSVVVMSFPRTHPVATNAIGTAVGTPLLLTTSIVVGERWALPELAPTWLASRAKSSGLASSSAR